MPGRCVANDFDITYHVYLLPSIRNPGVVVNMMSCPTLTVIYSNFKLRRSFCYNRHLTQKPRGRRDRLVWRRSLHHRSSHPLLHIGLVLVGSPVLGNCRSDSVALRWFERYHTGFLKRLVYMLLNTRCTSPGGGRSMSLRSQDSMAKHPTDVRGCKSLFRSNARCVCMQ